MRKWINIVEHAAPQALLSYLQGEFFHGTARNNLSFHKTAPAYLTQNKSLAVEYAEDDSEVDGGTPYVLCVRLHCTNPHVMEHETMQDLHDTFEHGDFVKSLLAQGFDCVVGSTGLDEICVIDPSKMEVMEVLKLRDADGESVRGSFGSPYSDDEKLW